MINRHAWNILSHVFECLFTKKKKRIKSVFHWLSGFVEFRNKWQHAIITPHLSLFQVKVLTGPFSYLIFNLIFLLYTSCHSVLILLLLSPTSPYHRSHFYLWHSISLLRIPIISNQLLPQPLHPANNLSVPLKDIIFLILLSRIPSYIYWIYASDQKINWFF